MVAAEQEESVPAGVSQAKAAAIIKSKCILRHEYTDDKWTAQAANIVVSRNRQVRVAGPRRAAPRFLPLDIPRRPTRRLVL